MDKQEIVKWLESLKVEIGKSEHGDLWHYAESIDMAIEALQERPNTDEDAISRQYAIDALKKDIMGGLNYEWILQSLPPVEPQRPKGEWIYLKEDETLQPEMGWFGTCKCSNCSEQKSFPMGNTTKEIYGDNFCPNCGASMRGEK